MFAVSSATKWFPSGTDKRWSVPAETAAAALVAVLLWVVFRIVLVSVAGWLGAAVPDRIARGLESDGVIQPLRKLSWAIPVVMIVTAVQWRRLVAEKHGPLLIAITTFALVLNARWLFYIGFYGLFAPPVALLFFITLQRFGSRLGAQRPLRRYLAVCLLLGAAFTMVRYRGLD
jgi:hypothetical protein